jgi:hypothetical protein
LKIGLAPREGAVGAQHPTAHASRSSGPGDSGGPALLEIDGVVYVAGVSAYNDGGELCTYGTTEYYSRVSTEHAWLDGVMSGEIGPSRGTRVMRYGTNESGEATVQAEKVEEIEATPDQVAAVERVARALIRALNAEDEAGFQAQFSDEYLRREQGMPLESMFGFITEVRAIRGDIVSLHPVSTHALRTADAGAPMYRVVWPLADGMAGYFGIVLDDDERISRFSLFIREDICRGGASCGEAVPIGDRKEGSSAIRNRRASRECGRRSSRRPRARARNGRHRRGRIATAAGLLHGPAGR